MLVIYSVYRFSIELLTTGRLYRALVILSKVFSQPVAH